MTIPQYHIVDDVKVGKIGYGLMNLTWKPKVTPDEQAFAAMLTSLEAGSTYIDAGEFYGMGPKDTFAGLEILARFFDKHPEWAEPGKFFLSVKGGDPLTDGKMCGPDGSEENLRKSVDNINKRLGGKRTMDLFQMARVDPNIPIEEVIRTLQTLVEEGKFRYIGLSECSAQTIRKAHAVHPIAAVEVEYSMWSLNVEQNGVLSTCKELGIPVIAYSPLGRGMLTGQIRKPEDIPEGDQRRHYDRFQPGNFENNLKLVDRLAEIASKKGCTTTQLALAWLLQQGVLPIPGSTRVEGVKEALGAADVKLSEAESKEIRQAVDSADIKGGRYMPALEHHLEG